MGRCGRRTSPAFTRLAWRYQVAFAFCSPEDQYSRKTGRIRALDKLSAGQGIEAEVFLDIKGQPIDPAWRPEGQLCRAVFYYRSTPTPIAR